MITYKKALQMDPRPFFEQVVHKDGYARRRAVIVRQNLEAMIVHQFDGRPHNRVRCTVLTLTFTRSDCDLLTSNQNALHRFKNLLRTYLENRFRAGIFVIETTAAGDVHVHILVVTDDNLAEGFDRCAYNAMKVIEKQARAESRRLTSPERAQRRRLGRALTTNPHLRALWAELRKLTRAARIDRAELTPLHGSPDQVARYLVKQLARGCRVEGLPPKKRRFGKWGWTWDRKVSDRPRGMKSERYRRNMKLICDYLGVEFIDSIHKPWMRANFGPKWGWHSLRASTLIDRYRQEHLEQALPDELLLSIIQDTIGLGCR